MRLPIALATFAASTVLAGSVLACSCLPPPDPATHIANTDHIFRGTVLAGSLSTTAVNARITAVVEVTETFKGDASGVAVIGTALQSATCGVPVTLGQSTVYFASKQPDQSYSVGLCSQLPFDSDRAAFETELDSLTPVSLPAIQFDRPMRIEGPIRIVPLDRQ